MEYLSRTFIELGDNRIKPGDTISDADLEAAGQTAEDVERLLEKGAITDDLGAGVLPEHLPVDVSVPTIHTVVAQAKALIDEMGDAAPQELHDLANMEINHVSAPDAGEGTN